MDGVTNGSPVGPTFVHVFLVYFEKSWLQDCPSDFKFHYYQRYVGDIFVLFTSLEHLQVFENFLNGRNTNMLFTIENEIQNRISLLDVQIIREDEKFATSVLRKPTFSGYYTHFDSFLPIYV